MKTKTGSMTNFFREVSEGEEWQQLEKEVVSREVLFEKMGEMSTFEHKRNPCER